MPVINLETHIKADIEIVFDLSRSIDLHKISTEHTNEEAIAGRTAGLIELNEMVTWRAKHFGIYQTLTSKVSQFERPTFFIDEQENGIFRYFKHEHFFKTTDEGTLMTDRFDYKSPLGILGVFADKIIIKKYMTDLLIRRNNIIREFAESNKWQEILNKKREIW
ncbi:SRPBCC family protein [Echinicola salinicaeni]|uniref:SRPBCC family protein n=1 Tax=Echinicola salinicaeni TaxID=2762757 RepID=UPI0016479CE9|nr:SRPBCC family protein [Echinicola salinicaeni]